MNTPIHWTEAWHTLRKLRLFFGFIVPADAVAVKIFTDLLSASGVYELLEAPGGLKFFSGRMQGSPFSSRAQRRLCLCRE